MILNSVERCLAAISETSCLAHSQRQISSIVSQPRLDGNDQFDQQGTVASRIQAHRAAF